MLSGGGVGHIVSDNLALSSSRLNNNNGRNPNNQNHILVNSEFSTGNPINFQPNINNYQQQSSPSRLIKPISLVPGYNYNQYAMGPRGVKFTPFELSNGKSKSLAPRTLSSDHNPNFKSQLGANHLD
jgi:hypothetical protein